MTTQGLKLASKRVENSIQRYGNSKEKQQQSI
jgi:hypothetical protein